MRTKKLIRKLIMAMTVFGLVLAMGLPVYAQGLPEELPETASSSQQNGQPAESLPPPQAESDTSEAEASSSQEPEAPPTAEDSSVTEEPPIDESSNSSDSQSEEPESGPFEENAPEEEETEEDGVEDDDEEDLEEDPAEGAEPFGLELNPSTVVVYDYKELKKALEGDNGYTTVYLGGNIAGDGSGIAIHANKANVVIDGSPPDGGRYTFTQYASGDADAVIRATRASVQSVTLRNMDIVGNNHFGVVMVSDSAQGVTLVHENVNYTGPQAFYNRGGTIHAINSTYTLQPTAGQLGELAEAKHAQFGGVVNITAAKTENSILWLVGGASNFTVLEGAQVTVNTDFYFVFYDGTPPNITIGQGACFSLTSTRFGFTYTSQHVANFLVAAGANLAINLHTTESYAALRVAGLFQMEPGSSATIVRTGTAGIPLRLTTSGAQAVFNQPQRVFLYSSAGVPLRFTGAGTLSITTQALNVWQSTGWPLAGGTEPLPTHIWNKAGAGLLTLTATYSTAANQSLVSNLTADDPVVSTLNAKNFDLEKSQLVVFGAMTLGIDIPTSQSPALTGGTSSGAALLAAYTLSDDKGGKIGGTANAAGRYTLPVEGGALKVGSTATVTASANGLAMRQSAIVQDGGAGRLSFLSVPQQLHFGSVPVPGGQTLVQRLGTAFALSVADSRFSSSPWRIDASVQQPLTAMVNGTPSRLTDAVVFQGSGETPLALNEVPMTVYRQNSGTPGEYTVQWNDGEGILLSLSPGEMYSGVDYTTAIHWQLVDAP
ncbi:hypothetical protein LJB76_02085 [Clostridia bacterium OttesenSCG-928-O13]|nr:hypothetical protein [Clostridia bacterium OttesenSCG-928-O13]